MLDFFKKLFSPNPPVEQQTTESSKPLSAKEAATKANEPYVEITSIKFTDPNNPQTGIFEFDWNDKMIANLIRSGYQLKPTDTDSEIIERWFQEVCRNVALEVAEQQAANFPEHDESEEDEVDYYDPNLLTRQIINTRIDNKLSESR
jgi:hypothetical protein